MHYLYFSM